jgi:hypothetical protein
MVEEKGELTLKSSNRAFQVVVTEYQRVQKVVFQVIPARSLYLTHQSYCSNQKRR